MRQHKAVGK